MGEREPYSIVAWYVEYRDRYAPGKWLTWPSPSDEEGASAAYRELVAGQVRTFDKRTEYQLVKRTATIADEILGTS